MRVSLRSMCVYLRKRVEMHLNFVFRALSFPFQALILSLSDRFRTTFFLALFSGRIAGEKGTFFVSSCRLCSTRFFPVSFFFLDEIQLLLRKNHVKTYDCGIRGCFDLLF